jgi:hypothetical protein
LPVGPALSDQSGWNKPEYYSTIQCADLDGDGQDNLLARGYGGMLIWKYNVVSGTWVSLEGAPEWSDKAGWNHPQYYTTIQCAEIDGYGQAELLARGAGGITVWQYDPVFVKTWRAVLQQAADPDYRARLITDPLPVLQQAGIKIPIEDQQAAAQLVQFILRPARAQTATGPRLEARAATAVAPSGTYISAVADWYGLTIYLSSQAAQDAANGVNIGAPLSSAIAAASSRVAFAAGSAILAPEVALIFGLISAYLWALGSAIGLMNRGNGVNLVVPWTSFIPPPFFGTPGLVIPLPA